MKSRFTILAVSLLLFSTLAFSQSADRNRSTRTPGVTKGYYSIGNHDRKLNPRFWRAPDTAVIPVILKGYYSIGSHNEKMQRKSLWFRKHRHTPVVTKGYYAIGDHVEKLANP